MTYVDGYVCAVPTANREIYRQRAAEAAEMFKAEGALAVVEAWGDDVPDGTLTSFPMAVQRKPDETVVFAWVTWPSRDVRNAAWEKMRDAFDERAMEAMPFDGKRMIYGGFETILEA
jgi:uncharacterized protein YbaA (DUF1428 family)